MHEMTDSTVRDVMMRCDKMNTLFIRSLDELFIYLYYFLLTALLSSFAAIIVKKHTEEITLQLPSRVKNVDARFLLWCMTLLKTSQML